MTTVRGDTTQRGPLAGYRVLDLADELGQLAGRLLGDLGADVIKVETPRRGDRTRGNAPFYKDQPGAETSLYWWAMNAGKRSVTCALQVEAGRSLFHRLVAIADVVIETNVPGTQAALGLDYATLSRINPGMVVVSVTPWGQSGPYVDKKYRSNDLVASAMAGLMHFDPADGEAPPWRTTMPQTYVHANTHAAVAAVTALFARATNGGAGSHVDVSLQAVADSAGARRAAAARDGRLFQASDGIVVTPPLGGLMGPAGVALIDWLVESGSGGDLGSAHWRTRLAGPASLDSADHAVVEDTIARFCSARSREWLVTEAQRRGGAWTPVNGVRDVVDSPQLAAQGAWVHVAHDDDGETFAYAAPPWRFDGGEPSPTVRAPRIGEHNNDIYVGLLGIDEGEVRRLRTRMVV